MEQIQSPGIYFIKGKLIQLKHPIIHAPKPMPWIPTLSCLSFPTYVAQHTPHSYTPNRGLWADLLSPCSPWRSDKGRDSWERSWYKDWVFKLEWWLQPILVLARTHPEGFLPGKSCFPCKAHHQMSPCFILPWAPSLSQKQPCGFLPLNSVLKSYRKQCVFRP